MQENIKVRNYEIKFNLTIFSEFPKPDMISHFMGRMSKCYNYEYFVNFTIVDVDFYTERPLFNNSNFIYTVIGRHVNDDVYINDIDDIVSYIDNKGIMI